MKCNSNYKKIVIYMLCYIHKNLFNLGQEEHPKPLKLYSSFKSQTHS